MQGRASSQRDANGLCCLVPNGVAWPLQWLPVLLAGAPPTRQRRLADSVFTTKASLLAAVRAYDANPTAAIATYGPIAGWDVSAITDMHGLFFTMMRFNTDISNWDTSSVSDMGYMFYQATAFNQPLSLNTSRVTTMFAMFSFASAFNQPLTLDTSSVTDMGGPCSFTRRRSTSR